MIWHCLIDASRTYGIAYFFFTAIIELCHLQTNSKASKHTKYNRPQGALSGPHTIGLQVVALLLHGSRLFGLE